MLGVHLDEHLSLKHHISHVCKVCFLNMRKIRSIRKFIDVDTCRTLVQGLVTSHLNYCNGLFMGLPESEISLYNVCKMPRLASYLTVGNMIVLLRPSNHYIGSKCVNVSYLTSWSSYIKSHKETHQDISSTCSNTKLQNDHSVPVKIIYSSSSPSPSDTPLRTALFLYLDRDTGTRCLLT